MDGKKRKGLSQKTRFEVFKRDSFTCQYCGCSSPNVILEVDHIEPVKHGGGNEFLNLITSCRECNRGKSGNRLNDNAIVIKQKEQLDLMNEKREQMKMVVKWKKELMQLSEEQVDQVDEVISYMTKGQCCFSDDGRKLVKKWIKKHGFSLVLECAEISCDQYLRSDSEGNFTNESVRKTIDYIPKICFVKSRPENSSNLHELHYICGIAKNRFSYYDKSKAFQIIKNSYEKGLFNIDELKEITLEAKTWSSWRDILEQRR